MIVPVGENDGKHGGAMLIIFINKYVVDDGKMTFDRFEPSTMPVCNKIFQLVLVETLSIVAFKKRLQDEIIVENVMFKMLDRIMQQSTMYDFCKAIEIYFAELFNC